MTTMLLGFLALLSLLLSGCCLSCKKPFCSFCGSIAAMILIYFTGHSWRVMLIGSGKDPTLLGFHRYPAALVILAALSVFAAVTMILSIRLARKQH